MTTVTVDKLALAKAAKLLTDTAAHAQPRGVQKLEIVQLVVRDGQLALIDWRSDSRVQVWIRVQGSSVDGAVTLHRDQIKEFLAKATSTVDVPLIAGAEPSKLAHPADLHAGADIPIGSALVDALRSAIAQTAPSAQDGRSDLGLTNVEIVWNESSITMTAGNHYHMSTATVAGAGRERRRMTLNAKQLLRASKLLGMLPEKNGTVRFSQRGNSLVATVDDSKSVIARAEYLMELGDGKYPDYRSLFDPAVLPAMTVWVQIRALVEAMSIASAGPYAGEYVEIEAFNGALMVPAVTLEIRRSHGVNGTDVSTAKCLATIEGARLKFTVNADYFRHAVSTIDTDISPTCTIRVWDSQIWGMIKLSAGTSHHIIALKV